MKVSRFLPAALLALALLSLLAIWLVMPMLVSIGVDRFYPNVTHESAVPDSSSEVSTGARLMQHGQFGDLYGSANALFSGLALIGIAASLYLQVQQRLRDRQPQLIARLSVGPQESPPTLIPHSGTRDGVVWIVLNVPVYLSLSGDTTAYNAEVVVSFGKHRKRQPTNAPISSAGTQAISLVLEVPASEVLRVVSPANVETAASYRLDKELQVVVDFENHQGAPWSVVATYELHFANEAESEILEKWTHNATAPEVRARLVQLGPVAKRWKPREHRTFNK